MFDNIPKAIQDEFTIINNNIKYPTFMDKVFQESISDDINFKNYSNNDIEKTFNDFFSIFNSCKNSTYEIIDKNLHNIQEYCLGLKQKTMNYIFYFYIIEKYAILIEKQFYKVKLPANLNKEFFIDDMIFQCSQKSKNFSLLFKKEFNGQNELNYFYEKFNPKIERYKELLQSKNEIGFIIVRAIKFLIKYLFEPLEDELNKFKKIKIFDENNFFKTKINERNEITLLNIIFYLKKLECLDFIFYNSALLDKNDICNLDENSKEWENLKKILFRIIPKNAEEIKNNIIESRKNPHLGNSIISNIQVDDSTTSLIISGLKNLVYYKMNENQSIIDSKRYQILNKPENIKEFLGLFKKFKYIFGKLLPNIEFRRKIYVKKELPPIDKMYIEKLINFMKGEKKPINTRRSIIPNNNINKESLPLIYIDKIPDKNIKRNYVSITILHKEKIFFKDEKNDNLFSTFSQCCTEETSDRQIDNNFRKNTIMITIHGGGFIGSSTFSHERYLRKWAKIINIPIFGINYSLSPEYQYPEALNDVYQAYMWILKHAKNELNMDIKHIILSGDSSGGNLALGLNNILIAIKSYEIELGKNIVLPELVLAQYPVTYINLKNISNSLLLSLFEPMLNMNTIIFTYQIYVGHYDIEDEDPFLNPIKVNNYILDRMTNKIRIFLGSEDIFRDDSIRLLNIFSQYNNRKNNKNNIDVRGYDIIYLGHGFNGLNEDIQQISRNIILPEIEDFLNHIE